MTSVPREILLAGLSTLSVILLHCHCCGAGSSEMGLGEGKEGSQGNRHCGLLFQEPQRSHTSWKRLCLTMTLTMCR